MERLICKQCNSIHRVLDSMVEKAANESDDKLGDYILKAVTEGISYDTLYRKFFYILDKLRDGSH